MKDKIFLFILLFVFIISGCGISNRSLTIPQQAFDKLDDSDKLKIQSVTPVQLIELYVDGINHDNPYLTISTLSRSNSAFRNGNIELEDVLDKYKGISIKNLKIVEDKEKNSKETDISNHFHFIVSYDLEMQPNSMQPNGSGEYYYFVDCLKEDDRWKINTFATSP